MSRLGITFLAILQFASAFASLFSDPNDVAGREYDYIIVGGGTAGATLAGRLSSVTSVRVLVIEAGLSDTGPGSDVISIPLLAGRGIGTQYDWNYTTTPQRGLGNRIVQYPRGFVLGGSSAINQMIYFRGPKDDFGRFANISGDSGWTWDNMFPFILKDEQHVKPWNNRSDAGEFNPAVHGSGPLLTSVTASPQEVDTLVFKAATQSSGEFTFNEDLNSGNGLGLGWLQSTVGNSVRSTSSSVFLRPALSRGNLDVLIQTQVIRLFSTNGTSFRGVQFSQGPGSPVFNLTAKEEVIVSAGTIGSPQLLMLSGIGPANELTPLGIHPIVNNANVGKNLQDQPTFNLQWQANFPTLNPFFNNATAQAEQLVLYDTNKTGLFAGLVVPNTISFNRLPSTSPALKKFGDPSAGPNSPHWVTAFISSFNANPNQVPPTVGDWISAAVLLMTPTSVGTVMLKTNSAFDHPGIDPAFLTKPFDIEVLKEALQALQSFVKLPAWKGMLGAAANGTNNLDSDAAIEAFIRNTTITVKHPVGTCSVSKVVDGQLKVLGTTGLRVVDASVLPFVTEGFPQARVYLLAERAASLIMEDFRSKQ